MTAPTSDALGNAESDLRTAQSEADPRRRNQYARSAADTATEVAVDPGASRADRARAATMARAARAIVARSALREAQTALAGARSESDRQRRRELASTAVSHAHQAAGNGDLTEEERAQARDVIANSRMVLSAAAQTLTRQPNIERDHEHEPPGIAL